MFRPVVCSAAELANTVSSMQCMNIIMGSFFHSTPYSLLSVLRGLNESNDLSTPAPEKDGEGAEVSDDSTA